MIPEDHKEFRHRMHHDGEDFVLRKITKRTYVSLDNSTEFFWILSLETDAGEEFYLFMMPNGDRILTTNFNCRTYMDRRLKKGINYREGVWSKDGGA